jgi:hypothetical protein
LKLSVFIFSQIYEVGELAIIHKRTYAKCGLQVSHFFSK